MTRPRNGQHRPFKVMLLGVKRDSGRSLNTAEQPCVAFTIRTFRKYVRKCLGGKNRSSFFLSSVLHGNHRFLRHITFDPSTCHTHLPPTSNHGGSRHCWFVCHNILFEGGGMGCWVGRSGGKTDIRSLLFGHHAQPFGTETTPEIIMISVAPEYDALHEYDASLAIRPAHKSEHTSPGSDVPTQQLLTVLSMF